MDDLGNMVILIGKNGSGKSNILETLELFFTDLDLLSDTQKAFPPETWYDKRTRNPIEFIFTIELDNEDMKNIFTEDILNISLIDVSQIGNKLTIHRNIEVNMWKNKEINFDNTLIIKNGKGELQLGVVEDAEEREIEPIIEMLKPEVINMILINMNNILKNSFKLIRSPRESPERKPPTVRPSIIDPESMSILTNLANNPKDREEEVRWTEFEERYKNFSGKDMRTRANQLVFRIGNLALPIELSGSGDQAIMILMRHFLEKSAFYGIEEPETRLHHGYQRNLFTYLKSMSEIRQIFVSTHSCIFVDRSMLKNTWFVSLKKKESIVNRLENENIKKLLIELDVKPSDIFLSNTILFVEGYIEKYLLPLFCEKIGLDISTVSIIPIHGKGKGKYHLSVWIDAAKNTNLPIYFMLDGDAETEINKLVEDNLLDRDDYLLLKGNFEDYYPKKVLSTIIKNLIKSDENIELEKAESVVDEINSLLKRKDWKLEVGLSVLENANVEQIQRSMNEIIRFLRRIRS